MFKVMEVDWSCEGLTEAECRIIYASFKFAVKSLFIDLANLRLAYIVPHSMWLTFTSGTFSSFIKPLAHTYSSFAEELCKQCQRASADSVNIRNVLGVINTCTLRRHPMSSPAIHAFYISKQHSNPSGALVRRMNGELYFVSVAEDFVKHPDLILKSLS